MTHVDYIIVGQGIAGTSVAQRLLEVGQTILVMDEARPNQASRIASGIWNPIVLKRLKKVWMADAMLAALDDFYRDAQTRFGGNFLANQQVHRVFANAKEVDEWLALCDNPKFEHLLDHHIVREMPEGTQPAAGLGMVRQSGRIDTTMWLDAARQYFKNNHMLREEAVFYDALIITDAGVQYQDVTAKGIVFCEGMYAAQQNPFFRHLPFALTKGEVLIIDCPGLKLNKILHGSVFVLPLGNHHFKIGATYNWHPLDFSATQEARDELIAQAKKIISLPFSVVEHEVGIRPTVKDRRPLMGSHPRHKNVYIFNGMGSRGVLMAPYLSAGFVHFLQTGSGIPPEANIARFMSN